MAVHFVYRCAWEGLTGKYIAHFEDESVLTWFRHHWDHLSHEEEAYDRLAKLLGCDVAGFGSLFSSAAEHSLPAPESEEQLRQYLEDHLYVEGYFLLKPGVIQVLTDDDEIEMAYYLFDDHFLARHGKRAAYLLHEGWDLPDGAGKGRFRPVVQVTDLNPRGPWKGAIYAVMLEIHETIHLTELEGAYRLRGVRLPQFARYLTRAVTGPADWPLGRSWPLGLSLLRSQLLAAPGRAGTPEVGFLEEMRADPGDETSWLVYSDWLAERGELPADLTLLGRGLEAVSALPLAGMYDRWDDDRLWAASAEEVQEYITSRAAELAGIRPTPTRSRVQVEEHVAQVALHAPPDEMGYWPDRWDHWVFFDDLWASAYPDLANALLVHAARWDVLSDPSSPVEEAK